MSDTQEEPRKIKATIQIEGNAWTQAAKILTAVGAILAAIASIVVAVITAVA